MTSNYINKLYKYTIKEAKTFIREKEKESIHNLNEFEKNFNNNYNKFNNGKYINLF